LDGASILKAIVFEEAMKRASRRKPPTRTNLGLALTAYQQKYDIPNGAMAKEIGIRETTMSKIKGGAMPDSKSLVKILAWLFGAGAS
jgi:hypothetical protein